VLTRTNLALALLSPDDAAFGRRLDPLALAKREGFDGGTGGARFFTDLLVQDAFDRKVRDSVNTAPAREAAAMVLTSPEYQLA
jgi:hypothetical protein